MRQRSASKWLALFAVLIAVLIVYAAVVQSTFTIESTDVTVYRDGLVHVEQTLLLDEYSPQAYCTLLASNVENLVVLDQNQLAVDYNVDGKILVIYSLGASTAHVAYDTNSLTGKENEIWTLSIDNPYDITVGFPVNSTVVYLSDAPTAIETANNQVSLQLHSGQWEISYLLQLISGDQNSQNQTSGASNEFPFVYLIIIICVVILIVGISIAVFFLKRKQRFNINKALKENPQLMKEDREVLAFLAEKEGKAFEAEIRERFPDMPRTSLWRLVKRLEKLELVEVKKIGLENQVILKK